MKTLTKLQLIELLKTKQATAFLKDESCVDVPSDVALNWFDQIIQTGETSYMAETKSYIWIAADMSDFGEQDIWKIGGPQ